MHLNFGNFLVLLPVEIRLVHKNSLCSEVFRLL